MLFWKALVFCPFIEPGDMLFSVFLLVTSVYTNHVNYSHDNWLSINLIMCMFCAIRHVHKNWSVVFELGPISVRFI